MADDAAAQPARTLEDPLAEVVTDREGRRRTRSSLRLLGGMAVRAHSPAWPARTRRREVDLDFATRSKDRSAVYRLLEEEGYTPDRRHNALFGQKQAYFVDEARHRPVDVLVDRLEMCPRPRVRRPSGPLPPDAARWPSCSSRNSRSSRSIARTCSTRWPPRRASARRRRRRSRQRPGLGAINVTRIVAITSGDWGWWRTVTRTSICSPRSCHGPPRMATLHWIPTGRPGSIRPCQVRCAAGGHRRRAEVGRAGGSAPVVGDRVRVVQRARRDGPLMRIFFATDIHGSEVCWRKFLNAAAFHKADVLIMGGDMTGKAMVPIVADGRAGRSRSRTSGMPLPTEADVAAMEKRIRDRGYYPVRSTREEVLSAGRTDEEARRRALQGRDPPLGRGLDCPRRRASRREGCPLHRVAGERRHVRDRPDHRGGEARGTRRGDRDRRGRHRNCLDWLVQSDAVAHLHASSRSHSSASASTARRGHPRSGAGRSSTSTPRRTARTSTTPRSSTPTCGTSLAARRLCRSALAQSARRSRLRPTPFAPRAHPRGSRRGEARPDARGEPRQLIRGRRAPGGRSWTSTRRRRR